MTKVQLAQLLYLLTLYQRFEAKSEHIKGLASDLQEEISQELSERLGRQQDAADASDIPF